MKNRPMRKSVMKTRLTCERLDDRACPAVFGNPWLHPDLTLSFVADGTLVDKPLATRSSTCR